nr:bifunctional diguanylate cyclase/phosphodiesterase [Xylophilus sp. ASV27]
MLAMLQDLAAAAPLDAAAVPASTLTLATPAVLFLLQLCAAALAGRIAVRRLGTGVLVAAFGVAAACALLGAAAQLAGPWRGAGLLWAVARVAEAVALAGAAWACWRGRRLLWGAGGAALLLIAAAVCEWRNPFDGAELMAVVLRIGAYALLGHGWSAARECPLPESPVQEAEDQWLAVLRQLPGGITRLDRQLRIRFINETHARWFGRSVEDLLGRSLAEILPPERYERLERHLHQALGGETVVFDNQVPLAPGDVRYRHNTMVPERCSDGSVQGVLYFVIDVTERKLAELALAEQQSRLRSLVEAIPDMVFSKDCDSVYTSCNQVFADFIGVTPQQIVGMTDYDMVLPAIADNLRVEDRQVMESGEPLRSERKVASLRRDVAIAFETIKTPLRDAAGNVIGVVGVSRDVTERKRAEREIEQLAFYDTLTGLPNRRRLLSQLEEAVWVAAATGSHGALLLINLDHFKNLNDVLGHDAGDQWLQLVAQRLQRGVAANRVLARLGGDEFAMVLNALGGDAALAAQAAREVATALLEQLAQPFDLTGRRHYGSASMGIRMFSQPALPAEELLQQASLAVDHALQDGRNTLRFFDPAMQQELSASAALEADLHEGLRLRQMLLHYQPVVDTQGRMLGAEALLRWQHPQRGMVSPAAFIGLAEQNGLILPLGEWVLRAACEQLAAWSQQPVMRDWYLAVNVSARQFRHPDFLAQVDLALAATGANPCRLKLELTETMLLRDTEDARDKLARLKARGMGLSLDDFGTGFSSLGYLRRLPLDQLKIDQSFVRDMLVDANGAAIVRTILGLAQSLDLDVVAEGVEMPEQFAFLLGNGCRAFQGYLFARPMPVHDLERLWGAGR